MLVICDMASAIHTFHPWNFNKLKPKLLLPASCNQNASNLYMPTIEQFILVYERYRFARLINIMRRFFFFSVQKNVLHMLKGMTLVVCNSLKDEWSRNRNWFIDKSSDHCWLYHHSSISSPLSTTLRMSWFSSSPLYFFPLRVPPPLSHFGNMICKFHKFTYETTMTAKLECIFGKHMFRMCHHSPHYCPSSTIDLFY